MSSLSSIISSSLEENNDGVLHVMETIVFSLAVGCLVTFGSNFIPDAFQLPSIVVFGIGIACGAATGLWGVILSMDPEVILLVFLPPVLFQSGLGIDFHVFKRVALQSIILAGPGAVISAAITTLSAKFLFLDYDWSWTESLLLGAALSATDPVATVATIKRLGASPKVSVLIEGEALLNDGSAYVMFFVVYNILATGVVDPVAIITDFVQLSIGGPLFGLLCGIATYIWLRCVSRMPVLETGITIAAVLATMFISELLGVSGVLALVCFGLFMAYKGKYGYSPGSKEYNYEFWEQMEFLVNAILFFFAGVIVFSEVQDTTSWGEWLNMVTLFFTLQVSALVFLALTVQIARAIGLLILYPVMYITGYGFNWKLFVLVWSAGLRGGVSLSLGLIVSAATDLPHPFTGQFAKQIAGAVALTSIINGVLSKALYPLLRFEKTTPMLIDLFQNAIVHLEREVAEFIQTLEGDPFFSQVDLSMITAALPKLVKEGNLLELREQPWVAHWVFQLRRRTYPSGISPSSELALAASNIQFDESDLLSEETSLASEMYVNAVKASYAEQFENISHLGPSSVSNLIEIADVAAEKSNMLFSRTWDILSKLLKPHLLLKKLLRVPLLKYVIIYFEYSRIHTAIKCSRGLSIAYSQASSTVLKETGVSFEGKVAVLNKKILAQLEILRHTWGILYDLAETAAATTSALYCKREGIRDLNQSGFINNKTKDAALQHLNKAISRLKSVWVFWKFRKTVIDALDTTNSKIKHSVSSDVTDSVNEPFLVWEEQAHL